MITKAFAENYRDSYEAGMTVEEMVEFFHDCQKSAPEDTKLAALNEKELEELARFVIEINEEA